MAGGLLALTLSLDDFVITFFTAGPDSVTFPIKIYSLLRRGISPDINAASTVLILLTLLLAGVRSLVADPNAENNALHSKQTCRAMTPITGLPTTNCPQANPPINPQTSPDTVPNPEDIARPARLHSEAPRGETPRGEMLRPETPHPETRYAVQECAPNSETAKERSPQKKSFA